MMTLPAIASFAYEDRFKRWSVQATGADFDLAVPDEAGRPMAAALALLEQALPDRERLCELARQHIGAFCPASVAGPESLSTLIEIVVEAQRGELVVRVVLNDDSDLYSLWSVSFAHVLSTHWVASAFRREAW